MRQLHASPFRAAACTAAALVLLGAGTATAATSACSSVAACVFGQNTGSEKGVGLAGTSTSGNGIDGHTTVNSTSGSTGRAGVAGYDGSTNGSLYNYGVLGTSSAGSGVGGKASSGVGVYGDSASGIGVVAKSARGTGLMVRSSAADQPALVVNAQNSVALSAVAFAGNADGMHVNAGNPKVDQSGNGIVSSLSGSRGTSIVSLVTPNTGGSTLHELNHFDAYTNGSGVVSIDEYGNVSIAGALYETGAVFVKTRGSSGAEAVSFEERTSSPALDDMGEARLVNGEAYVPLEPAFAAQINFAVKYLVFITPQGDNRGLYVTEVTKRGFAVRECNRGRATLAFDYRIVAQPYDTKSMHLPPLAAFPQFRPRLYRAERN